MWVLSCSIWDPVPQPGIKLGPLALGVCEVLATGPLGNSWGGFSCGRAWALGSWASAVAARGICKGDRHILNVTVMLHLQNVSLYRPESGASEEGLASWKAEPVSFGVIGTEDRGKLTLESLAGEVDKGGQTVWWQGRAEGEDSTQTGGRLHRRGDLDLGPWRMYKSSVEGRCC